jgi:hypothetical protein
VSIIVQEITARGNLDPITVYWHDTDIGKGSVTITCYGNAWTSWWGAMGGNTVKEFFLRCDEGYLFNNLANNQVLKQNILAHTYIKKIIATIKAEGK